jgi:FdhD protein
MTDATASASRLRWRPGQAAEDGSRLLAEETPIALVHDGSTTAVMMATPAELEDFAVGFSLSERVVESVDEITDLEVVQTNLGVEVRMWLAPDRTRDLAARRRRLAGPTGCGLCGVESLAEATRPPLRIAEQGLKVSARDLLAAMTGMEAAQTLGRATRAVHAAGLWNRDGGLVVREDVGRHNALDKLIGAAARAGTLRREVLLLTSRVSVEMVQKAAVMGAEALVAVSAPTTLAIETAKQAGMTLVGVARADSFEVFAGPERIVD